MATDNERREVAERMRGPFDVCGYLGHTYINGTLYGMQVCARDELALRDGMRHLADLIDPTCHAVHPDTAADDELVCSECGAYMGAIAPFIGAVLPLCCPSCGARVVEGGEG